MKRDFTKWLLVFVAMFFAQGYMFAQASSNHQVGAVTGDFTARWVATPSHDNLDGVTGLGKSPVVDEGWSNMGILVQFAKD
ncbi:MAG: hypothetical protein ABFS10_10680, partial [Bacteroidota bacterium]